MAELSDYQKDILVRTVLGEARGEGLDGMEAVAQVIRNRSGSGQFPSDPAAVALQPSQFSVWNSGAGGGKTDYSKNSDLYRRAEQAVERVFSGQAPDRTNGALYYHTPAVSPYWADEANQYGTTRLGNHIFYNGRPTPPGEIPNQVASLTDTVGPRVAPNPATISPDLALMRNPQMSSSARMAQVTPPLPQPRPVSPMDIARAPGTTVATIPTSMRPGQSPIERMPPMPSAREIAMAPGQTIATIPTSGIGQPPATRVVPSVPYTLQPTAREIAAAPGVTVATIPTTARPNTAQINDAARRAALTANQGNVERAIPTMPMVPTAPTGSASANINAQRAEQLGQRAATNIPMRLSPGVAAQNYDISINGPPGLTRQQFAALPTIGAPLSPAMANVPFPRARPNVLARAVMPLPAPRSMPRQQVAPLRIVVQRDQQQQPVQVASNWAPQGYTNDGTGRITSNETGGVYYERHLR